MYNPKDILTEDGYEDYKAHLRNIENGLFFIENHADDLHIGAINGRQYDTWHRLLQSWFDLKEVLKKGDGEKE